MMAVVHARVQEASAARLPGKDGNVDRWWQYRVSECARLRGDTLRLLDRVDKACAHRVPPVRWNGRPAVNGMLGDSGEADGGALVEPLLPVAQVGHDFCDRVRKAVGLRMRLFGGEAVKDRPGVEMNAFTPEDAGQ